MAPALLGPHLQMECPDCQFSFAFGLDSTSNEADFVCPNCGFFGPADEAIGVRGQRVSIGRTRHPHRFDTVVAQLPEELITKRVVGLPGETVRIENGDLFVDEQIVCKSPPELLAMAVDVHRDHYRPTSLQHSSRWRAATENSGWTTSRSNGADHLWQPLAPPNGVRESNRDWLVYHHSVALPPPFERGSASPLTDNCSYNQGTSRILNRISDCFVAMQASWDSPGTICFRRTAADRSWVVEFDTATGRATLVEQATDDVSSSRVLTTADKLLPVKSHTAHSFLFGYWDGSFHFLHKDRLLLRYALDVQDALADETRPFSIAADQVGELRVSRLAIRRDVYYTDAYGTNQPWSLGRALGPDEFLTLGDNSPVSRDSRHAESLGVFRRDQVIGRVREWDAADR